MDEYKAEEEIAFKQLVPLAGEKTHSLHLAHYLDNLTSVIAHH